MSRSPRPGRHSVCQSISPSVAKSVMSRSPSPTRHSVCQSISPPVAKSVMSRSPSPTRHSMCQRHNPPLAKSVMSRVSKHQKALTLSMTQSTISQVIHVPGVKAPEGINSVNDTIHQKPSESCPVSASVRRQCVNEIVRQRPSQSVPGLLAPGCINSVSRTDHQ